MKIQNFEISKNFRKKSKFQNFEFSLTFSTKKKSIKNRKILVPKKFSTKSFRIFFDEKFFDQKFLGYLFRSQIFPRFQKSHLENRAMSLKMRKTGKTSISPLILCIFDEFRTLPPSLPSLWKSRCVKKITQ